MAWFVTSVKRGDTYIVSPTAFECPKTSTYGDLFEIVMKEECTEDNVKVNNNTSTIFLLV